MTNKRSGPPAAQQPPEGQKSGRHTDYTNGNTRHSGWSAMFQRRKIAALRSVPLPWTGRRDPDNPLEGAVGFMDKTGRRHGYQCTCTMCFHAIVGDAA